MTARNPYTSKLVTLTAEQKAQLLASARKLAKSMTASEAGYVSKGNAKLHELAEYLGVPKSRVVAWNVLSGHTCPFADVCKAWVVEAEDGSLTLEKGEDCEFVCYQAKLEAFYKSLYHAAKKNTEQVREYHSARDPIGLALWIMASLLKASPKLEVVRWHAGGDFFLTTYVVAADIVAQVLSDVQFFGYTKSPWVAQTLTNGENCHMVHSHGSKYDSEAVEMGLPQSFVRCSPDQYADVPTACEYSTSPDDYDYIRRQESFAINVH